jgi:hypothetical protein
VKYYTTPDHLSIVGEDNRVEIIISRICVCEMRIFWAEKPDEHSLTLGMTNGKFIPVTGINDSDISILCNWLTGASEEVEEDELEDDDGDDTNEEEGPEESDETEESEES